MLKLDGPEFPSNWMRPGFAGCQNRRVQRLLLTHHHSCPTIPPTTNTPYGQQKTMDLRPWRGNRGIKRGDPGWGDPVVCSCFILSCSLILFFLFLFFSGFRRSWIHDIQICFMFLGSPHPRLPFARDGECPNDTPPISHPPIHHHQSAKATPLLLTTKRSSAKLLVVVLSCV